MKDRLEPMGKEAGGGRHLRLDTKSNFLRGTEGKSICC